MKRIICLLSLFFGYLASASAQGTGRLAGKIINEKNEALAGVTVSVKGTNLATASTVDGSFILSVPAGSYEVTFTALGYASKIITGVEVKATGTTDLDIVLQSTTRELETVEVRSTASARKETVNSAINFQRNTNTVASVVSAEAIRRSPDRTTGDVLRRTPGASLQEGRFLVIRGLADRYNQAMLNGILLTSTEPDRKTFAFDLIPAAVIDNIVINKAFVPEYPGEWAGGLVQVNTRDVPARNFFNIQLGTNINTQTTFRDFYREREKGKWDWLGLDDGSRALPQRYTTKTGFDTLSRADKTRIGKSLRNSWSPVKTIAAPGFTLQANAGFRTRLLTKTVAGTLGIIYNRSNRYIPQENNSNTLATANVFTRNFDLDDDRYSQDVSWGSYGSLTWQFDQRNRVSLKSLLNVNTSNSVTQRSGFDFNRDEALRGSEFSFRQNTFSSSQLTGDHKLDNNISFRWYGSFNILDGYVPDQRRILYGRQRNTADPFLLLISNTLSQQSGSRIFQNLSDYIYTAGGDLNYGFNLFGQKQAVKAGYMFQSKDRLYDAKLFAIYLPNDNPALRQMDAAHVFSPENYGNGDPSGNMLAFDAIKNRNFRYMANTILNAGFIQFDNQFTSKLRAVWGLRVEDYDQLIGSARTWDPRHQHVRVRDFLPGLNATFRFGRNNNLRLTASQTVIRPELRELSFLNLYDFELNASVQGEPDLQRTRVSNLDLRYEWYPKAGEMFTIGAFYKYFNKPIEQFFDEGVGGASTFSFANANQARSYGMELELRKKLDFTPALKHFSLQLNAAWIHSRIKDEQLNIDRPLQGQSPYLLNAGLMYDLPEKAFTTTILFNQIGERIYLVGSIQAGAGSPDIYEAPRPVLDIQFSKKVFGKRGEFRLNISDIINQTQVFYQNGDGNERFQKSKDAYRFTRRFGTSFSLTFNYSFTH